MSVAKVLFEDGHWGQVEVRGSAAIQYHPTEPGRLLVLFVDEDERWRIMQRESADHGR